MPKSLMKMAVTALALATAAPVFAQEMAIDRVVATVNGTEITLGHMLLVRAALPEQYQQLPNEALWDGILEQLVQQEVLAQSPEAEETKRYMLAIQNERRALLASEVISTTAADAATEEAIQRAYNAEYASADEGKEFNASHILSETEAESQAIYNEVSGGADFSETARTKSTGPSGANGGSLGWFSAGMMVEDFQKAVEAMQPGDISGPIKTQFGWHVIKLNEIRVKEAPKLEDVREQLLAQIQQDAVQARIDQLVSMAEITRVGSAVADTSLLSQFELLEK
ncbi:MAG: peptidylprolyl isomerase [Pelagimonas sp.]|jgi:peptidyl-prolyl cis-trans isomerase C|nr:peptidylprolyl isomerase [Pelagimonas sp.]